jgi:uncharacterized repeat protein (TIGR02543 family)
MKRTLLSICPLLIAAFAVGTLILAFQLQAEAALVLLSDDFEDGDADGWTEQAGTWSVVPDPDYNIYYRVVYTGTSPTSRRSYITETTVPGSSTWTDYVVQAKFKTEGSTENSGFPTIIARWQNSKNYYYLGIEGDGDVRIRKYVDSHSFDIGNKVALGLAKDTWYTATLEVSGSTTPTLRAYIDGVAVMTRTDDANVGGVPPFLAGPCALGSSKATVQFDNVLVTDIGGTTTLFSDDFEDGNADDWVEQAGKWEVTADNYVYQQTNMGVDARSYAGSAGLTDYSIQARVKMYDGTYAMLIGRWQDKDNHYFMAVRSNGEIEIKKRYLGSSGSALESANYTYVPGMWYTATLEITGNPSPTLRAFINGTAVITVTDDGADGRAPFSAGEFGLGSSKAHVDFDDVVVTDLQIFTLAVGSTGTGSGSITSDPPGIIDCGTTCTADLESGTVVTLTATPTGTHEFAGWLGACTGTGDCVVTMDAAKSVTAVFSSQTDPMLVVNKAGTGDGTVTSVPEGIDCGITCTTDFPASTVVTLTAEPAMYSTFTGWSGDCTNTTGVCVVTMDAAKNVTASFYERPLLTVTKDGNGSGLVESDPPGIDCGVTCTARFDDSTVVTLTATSAADSDFVGWGGACSGTDPCVLTMNEAKDVTATFSLKTYVLTVNRAGNGMGSVLSDPAGINNCSTVTCTASFDHGTMVTLTATANTLSTFDGWSGEGCSGTGSCTVMVDAGRTVTATFNTHLIYLPLVMGGSGVTPTGPDFSMVGYATVTTPTTGGANGTVVTVTTLSDLQTYAGSTDPYIIQVNGTISATDSVDIASDKTIVGVGSSGVLVGVELRIGSGVSNVIIRNLKISHVMAANRDGDAIHIQGPDTHHIWIDHCDLSSDLDHYKDYYDGLLDMSHDVDHATVSWTVFHDHFKGSLIGHSDSNAAEDEGSFHTTYHHNYFYNVNSRMPSNRFGTLHSYNNYFNNTDAGDVLDANSGISSRMGACSRVENNHFAGLKTAIMTDQSATLLGEVQLIDNLFENVGGYATEPTCELTPPYAYTDTLHSTLQVQSIVTQYAGVGIVADPLVWNVK